MSSYQKTKDSKILLKCSEHYSKLISSHFLDSAIFIPQCHSKIIQDPHPSKISNNVSGRCDISTEPLEYIIRGEMWPLNVQLHGSNYKWQLHVSATK